MKIKIEGFITRYQPEWREEPIYWFSSSAETGADTICACPWTIEAEVPDGDMIPERVAAIREAKRQAHIKAAETIAKLDEKEQKLLSLTNGVES